MTRLTDEQVAEIERAAKNDAVGYPALYPQAAILSLVAEVRASRSAPGLREAVERLVRDLDALIAESNGVAGLHRNGDLATWDWLMDEWLASLPALRSLLSTGTPATAAPDVCCDLGPADERGNPHVCLLPHGHVGEWHGNGDAVWRSDAPSTGTATAAPDEEPDEREREYVVVQTVVETLAHGEVPTCECGNDAVCVGVSEGRLETLAVMCDTCCGHGNEDGWCVPIARARENTGAPDADLAATEAVPPDLHRCPECGSTYFGRDGARALDEARAEGREEGRRAGLEEAAKLPDARRTVLARDGWLIEAAAMETLAARIRALAAPTPGIAEAGPMTWGLSTDEESFHGHYATKEEALANVASEIGPLEPGQRFWVGGGHLWRPSDAVFDADGLFDRLVEHAGDECGDVGDDWLSGVSRSEKEDLESSLHAVLLAWLARTGNLPQFYCCETTEEHRAPTPGIGDPTTSNDKE